jgi:ABC-type Zn uptake system ZnuABC Zn-binding protein ZnuA
MRLPYAPAAVTMILLLVVATGCRAAMPVEQGEGLRVLAVESFLADIAQNVAGDRLTVGSLIPLGVDPHGFEPTPADVVRVAQADVLIVNGAGLEVFLEALLQNAGGQSQVIVASAGLTPRQPQEGEEVEGHHEHEEDPHFWLDPILVVRYVENIRDGLSQADPAGADVYAANAADYIARLQELDAWIAAQVAQVPAERRLLVTNHESLGYFADRYGFRVVGTLLESVSSGASPSAQQMAELVERIRASGAPAIFLETGANPQLAEQIGRETGVEVVTDLYTHSLSAADGPAPTYIEMMRHNTARIVEALR